MRITLAFLCLIFGIFLIAYGETLFPFAQTPPERFNTYIAEDLKNLYSQNKLPRQWSDLKSVVIQVKDPALYDWTEKINLPLNRNPEGTSYVEVAIMRWSDSPKYGVLVQFELFDLKTKNKIFELNRYYHIGYEW